MINLLKEIMNPEKNGLSGLTKVVKFQIMTVLSFLWSVIFCISAGLFIWLPGYIFAHIILLVIGIFGTSWIFGQSVKD